MNGEIPGVKCVCGVAVITDVLNSADKPKGGDKGDNLGVGGVMKPPQRRLWYWWSHYYFLHNSLVLFSCPGGQAIPLLSWERYKCIKLIGMIMFCPKSHFRGSHLFPSLHTYKSNHVYDFNIGHSFWPRGMCSTKWRKNWACNQHPRKCFSTNDGWGVQRNRPSFLPPQLW